MAISLPLALLLLAPRPGPPTSGEVPEECRIFAADLEGYVGSRSRDCEMAIFAELHEAMAVTRIQIENANIGEYPECVDAACTKKKRVKEKGFRYHLDMAVTFRNPFPFRIRMYVDPHDLDVFVDVEVGGELAMFKTVVEDHEEQVREPFPHVMTVVFPVHGFVNVGDEALERRAADEDARRLEKAKAAEQEAERQEAEADREKRLALARARREAAGPTPPSAESEEWKRKARRRAVFGCLLLTAGGGVGAATLGLGVSRRPDDPDGGLAMAAAGGVILGASLVGSAALFVGAGKAKRQWRTTAWVMPEGGGVRVAGRF